MCKNKFVVVQTIGFDSKEFRYLHSKLESAAWANLPVLVGILAVAESDGIARGCMDSYDPDWDDWYFEVSCVMCDAWGTVPGPFGVGLAIAHVAKITTAYHELKEGPDISGFLLD